MNHHMRPSISRLCPLCLLDGPVQEPQAHHPFHRDIPAMHNRCAGPRSLTVSDAQQSETDAGQFRRQRPLIPLSEPIVHEIEGLPMTSDEVPQRDGSETRLLHWFPPPAADDAEPSTTIDRPMPRQPVRRNSVPAVQAPRASLFSGVVVVANYCRCCLNGNDNVRPCPPLG